MLTRSSAEGAAAAAAVVVASVPGSARLGRQGTRGSVSLCETHTRAPDQHLVPFLRA